MLPDAPAEPLQHPRSDQLLTRFDSASGVYEVVGELQAQYSRDVAGCWLVDGVVPDAPAAA